MFNGNNDQCFEYVTLSMTENSVRFAKPKQSLPCG